MVAAIHQLHYFPWMGYFNKMAKADLFIILDSVQLNDNSYMFRHKLLAKNGTPKYITIPFERKGYMQKEYRDILLNNNIEWQLKHQNFIYENYKDCCYFQEVWDRIKCIFIEKFDYLSEVTNYSMLLLKNILEIQTPLIYQHNLPADKNSKKSTLVLNLCRCCSATTYLSGNGAKKYLDLTIFEPEGIKVIFQEYHQPEYIQKNSCSFVPGLSTLDILFNHGINKTKEIFWASV